MKTCMTTLNGWTVAEWDHVATDNEIKAFLAEVGDACVSIERDNTLFYTCRSVMTGSGEELRAKE